jgi:SPP1 family predicted phage head-tail adaptor
VKAGELNQRIAIQARAAGTDDAGQPNGAWTHVGYLWANIAGDTGKAAIRRSGDVPVPYSQYSFKVRLRDCRLLGVTDAMRVEFDGIAFDVKGVLEDLGNRDAAFIVCERGGNEG